MLPLKEERGKPLTCTAVIPFAEVYPRIVISHEVVVNFPVLEGSVNPKALGSTSRLVLDTGVLFVGEVSHTSLSPVGLEV